jgi:hypothetical protein
MSDTTSRSRKLKLGTMNVTITQRDDTYHVRARKSTPLYRRGSHAASILESTSSGITAFNSVAPPGRNEPGLTVVGRVDNRIRTRHASWTAARPGDHARRFLAWSSLVSFVLHLCSV